MGWILRRQPRPSRRGRLQAACDAAGQLGFGASSGKRHADSDGVLGNAPGDRDQPHALHTAAHWLMLTVRAAIPKPQPLATAKFATLRTKRI